MPDGKYQLYLPIDMINFKQNIYITNCNITGALTTNNNAGLNFVNKLIENIDFDIFPQYTIIAWSINSINFPKNWKLCDGKSYIKINNILYDFDMTKHSSIDKLITPDLRARFIMHEYKEFTSSGKHIWDMIRNNNPAIWTQNYEFNNIGGLSEVTLERKHIPLHNHYIPLTIDSKYTHSNTSHSNISTNSKHFYEMTHSLKIRSLFNNYGEITSGLNILDSGDSCGPTVRKPDEPNINLFGEYAFSRGITPHNNIPPYCKLIYIIKL
jgi:microcystin-dependent protein